MKVLKIPFRFAADDRGSFIKPFSFDQFAHVSGLDFHPREMFVSTSHKNVLRGFHFQLPPADHGKLVFAIQGRVLDVAVDLRRGPTYGHVEAFELSPKSEFGVFLPKGFGHAFLSLEDHSTVGYLVDSVYSKENDQGVLWSSVDFDWPLRNPLISERDQAFPHLNTFQSPF